MKVIINESSVVKVLERLWSKYPYFDNDKLKMFGISANNISAQMLFQKFIGLEEMTRRAENIMGDFTNQELNIDECGTYDIKYRIVNMTIDEGHAGLQYIKIDCNVNYDRSTAIIPFYDPDANRNPLSSVILDKEIAWEVKSEILECIEEFFNDKIEIKKKTGMSVIAQLDNE